GGAYYAPMFFHLLPYVEQKNVYDMATWIDPTGTVAPGSTLTIPNQATTFNIGVIWPNWCSVNTGNYTWLRTTRIPVYQCPTDPTLGTNAAVDWLPGDASYGCNFQVFGDPTRVPNKTGSSPAWNVIEPSFDGKATLSATFQDGTSNTVIFAEKLAYCPGTLRNAGVAFAGINGSTSAAGTSPIPRACHAATTLHTF